MQVLLQREKGGQKLKQKTRKRWPRERTKRKKQTSGGVAAEPFGKALRKGGGERRREEKRRRNERQP